MSARPRIKKGSIHLIPFPFTDLSHKKVRPCIVLACDSDDLVVVFVTSLKPKDSKWIKVVPTPENGIKVASYIRYSKIATLDSRLSIGEIGTLERQQYRTLTQAVTDFLTKE